MRDIWDGLLGLLEQILRFLHGWLTPLFGDFAWGWAIVLLTVVVRVVLLPLAIKQINSMRAMQRLQPELKKIQAKHKVDRSLMRTDPEKFRAQRAKQQEAMMGLYKENQVNPAAGCLPLVLQMPVFFALFYVLTRGYIEELAEVGWYGVRLLSENAGVAGPGALVLVVLMGGTTYYSQKQMMAHNPASAQMPQTKILLYVMPIMLTVFAWNFPVGVLIYWVTTNLWTIAQQWVMFRRVEPDAAQSGKQTPPKRPPGRDRPKGRDKKKQEDDQ